MTSILSWMTHNCSASSTRPEVACGMMWRDPTTKATSFGFRSLLSTVRERPTSSLPGRCQKNPSKRVKRRSAPYRSRPFPRLFPRRSTTGDRRPRRVISSTLPGPHDWHWPPSLMLYALPRSRFQSRGAVRKAELELLHRAVVPMMIMPDYEASTPDCLETVLAVLNEVLSQVRSTCPLVIDDRTSRGEGVYL